MDKIPFACPCSMIRTTTLTRWLRLVLYKMIGVIYKSYDSNTDSRKVITPQISATSDIQNADLFFYIHEKDGRRAFTYYRLYGYHMESNSWSSLIVPAPNKLLQKRNGKYFLKKLNGRVILAFDFRPPWAPAALQGFTIWELNYSSESSAASWVQVARTPPKFWNRFHDAYDIKECANDTSYITNGRLICMTAVDFEDEHYGGNYASPLVYDLVLKSWYHLPPYFKGGTGFMGLFSFLPTSNIAK